MYIYILYRLFLLVQFLVCVCVQILDIFQDYFRIILDSDIRVSHSFAAISRDQMGVLFRMLGGGGGGYCQFPERRLGDQLRRWHSPGQNGCLSQQVSQQVERCRKSMALDSGPLQTPPFGIKHDKTGNIFDNCCCQEQKGHCESLMTLTRAVLAYASLHTLLCLQFHVSPQLE